MEVPGAHVSMMEEWRRGQGMEFGEHITADISSVKTIRVPARVVAVGLERKRWNSRNISKAEWTCPSGWVDLGILLEGAVVTLSEISVEPSHWDSISPSMPSICSSERQNRDDLGGSSFVFCGWCLAPKWLDYLWDIMFLHDDHVGLALLRTSSVD